MVVLINTRGVALYRASSSTLATDTARQLNILRHDSNTLGMDSSQICVFEQAYQVCLCSFLQCKDGAGLEPARMQNVDSVWVSAQMSKGEEVNC
jgi:hypothetical protein